MAQDVAPTRTLTVLGDQPIAWVQGSDAFPTMWFTQFLQRLASFIGSPPTDTGTTGATLTEVAVSAQVLSEIAIAIATGATTNSISVGAASTMAIARVPPQPLPQLPGLSQQQVLAMQYFGF
jgi:hypothetical protein